MEIPVIQIKNGLLFVFMERRQGTERVAGRMVVIDPQIGLKSPAFGATIPAEIGIKDEPGRIYIIEQRALQLGVQDVITRNSRRIHVADAGHLAAGIPDIMAGQWVFTGRKRRR